jgi:hypothetical protein
MPDVRAYLSANEGALVRLFLVPRVRPPRCSPGFDPRGMTFATLCYFCKNVNPAADRNARITSARLLAGPRVCGRFTLHSGYDDIARGHLRSP